MTGNRTDFMWVIEAAGPSYLSAYKCAGYRFRWSRIPEDALRFYTADQADATMMALRELAPELFAFEVTLGNAAVREHGWMRRAAEG